MRELGHEFTIHFPPAENVPKPSLEFEASVPALLYRILNLKNDDGFFSLQTLRLLGRLVTFGNHSRRILLIGWRRRCGRVKGVFRSFFFGVLFNRLNMTK